MRTFNISRKTTDAPKVQVQADYDHPTQYSVRITNDTGSEALIIQELPTFAHPPQIRQEFTVPVPDMTAAHRLAEELRKIGLRAIPIPADQTYRQA